VTDTSAQAKVSNAAMPPAESRNILTAAKGGGIVFAGNLFQNGSRFVIAFLMARFLGAEQLGLTHLSLSAVFISATLVALGLQLAMVRYVSLYNNRRDTAGLWGTLQIGLGLTTLLGVLAGIGLFFFAEPIAVQLFDEPRLAHLLQVVSFAIPFLAAGNIIAAATRGFKKMEYEVIGQKVSQPAIRVVLIVILAITIGLTAKWALIAFDIATVIVFVILLYFLNKLFTLKRPLEAARRDAGQILRFALPAYLSDLIRTFGGNIQIILLGVLNTAATVGVFAVASQINIMGRIFHSAVNNASALIVSELHDRGDREQLEHFYQTATKWTFTLNLPFFLVVLLFPVPILSVFGKSFIGGATALVILAWANLVNTGTGICGMVLDMSGNTTLRLVNSIVVFGLTLGLNALLIPQWGMMGAAIASLAAAILINLLRLSEVFFLFRLIPYNLSFIKPILAGLVALTIGWGILSLSSPDVNLFYIAINAVILLTVYAGMILLLGLSREDRMVLSRIGRRVKTVF